MERNVIKMIDLTQFMLMESTGDSEAKSDLDNCSFSKSHQGFLAEFDDDDEDENNDDDAESCSYGSSHSGYYADEICHGYRDKKNVHQHDDDDDDDGMSYHDDDDDDDEMEEDEDDDDDAIDSKMVEVSKKCGAWQDKRDCSNTRFLNEKENDKNFWETCLAS